MDEPYQVVHGWPELPDGFALGQVTGVTVDSDNRVFVFHRAENSQFYASLEMEIIASPTILCFDGTSGEFLFAWGESAFRAPHGLSMDPLGRLWLTDTELHQVFVYTPSGELLKTFGTRDTAGCDDMHFDGPTAVAFNAAGDAYVSDGYGNSRVVQISADGEYLGWWGSRGDGPGELTTPHGIAVADGRVYVASRGSWSIQVFTESGEFLKMWRSPELGRPWAISAGPMNALYVADGGDGSGPPRARNRLLKMTRDGDVLATWSRFGNYNGQVCWPHDIAVGPDGAVYVADVYCGMRVQRFMPTGVKAAAQ